VDSPSLLVRVLLTFVVGKAFLDRLLRHLLHASRVLLMLHLLRLLVLCESDLAGLDESVEGVHSLLHLASFTVVRGLLNGVVDFWRVLVDEDCEHLLSVGLLAIFSLGLSVYHNLLSPQSLRGLHHLLGLHLTHWVV